LRLPGEWCWKAGNRYNGSRPDGRSIGGGGSQITSDGWLREGHIVVGAGWVDEGVEEGCVEAAAASQFFASGTEKIETEGRELLGLLEEFRGEVFVRGGYRHQDQGTPAHPEQSFERRGSVGHLVHVVADALAEGEQLDDAVVEPQTAGRWAGE